MRGTTYLCCDTSLRAVVMHKYFEYLRNDLRQVDLLKQEKGNLQ